jgi:hypothetical protein
LDCTRASRIHRSTSCQLLSAIAIAATVAFGALVAGPIVVNARADGDPASDVLLSQPLFLPQDAKVSPADQARLTALLNVAHGAGDQLRVAIISGPADLGSVTALWRRPEDYARFLGQELALGRSGSLLVVMPNGYGFYDGSSPRGSAEQAAALHQIPPPGRNLGAGALAAIGRVAAASGLILAVATATTAHPAPGSGDALAWAVFMFGAIAILLAWGASLRARPPSAFARRPAKIRPRQ